MSESDIFLQGLSKATVVAIDTETTGLGVSSGRDYLMGLSLAFAPVGRYTVSTSHIDTRQTTMILES